MPNNFSWKLFFAARDHAAREGEALARINNFTNPPIDPFTILKSERELIHAEGYDFQEAFDGRIKYVGPRFLLCYNTRYNDWPHLGANHSKIVFTIAHELGHFFLPKHRQYLVSSKNPYGSFTEFTDDSLVEQEADFFATGLLMPGYMLRPIVNKSNFKSLKEFHEIRCKFDVSLTGMLVRWTELSDFPCATIVIQDGKIQYGWISQALRERGAFKLLRNSTIIGRDSKAFINEDPNITKYRDGTGSGAISNWIDYDKTRLLTEEHYFAIPHSQTVWVLVTADENDLMYNYNVNKNNMNTELNIPKTKSILH